MISIVCSTLAALMAAQPVQACRVFLSPEQRMSKAYAERAGLRVALVSITEARHLATPVDKRLWRLQPDYEAPWRATASIAGSIVDRGSPELLVFDRNWGNAASDDGTTMPKPGAQWIMYYVSDHPISTAVVVESYLL